MRIMFVINTMAKGGAERVVANLTSFLVKKNDVSIVTVYNTNIDYQLDNNINVYTLDKDKIDIYNKKSSSFLKKIRNLINRVRRLNKIKKEYKPDVVIAFMPLSSYIALLSKKIVKTKTIISIRNDPKIEYSSKFDYILMKLLYNKADGTVFQTEEAKQYFNASIQEKSIIIPNPINEDFIRKSFDGERNKEIVSVGRLEEQKQQKMLITAFNMIKDNYTEYKLRIFGEGQLRKELEDYIEQLNLNGRVLLPGKSDNIKDDIYKSEMFVLSSSYEGMPNSLMEAMALGLPVISTDCPCGGPRFLIKDNINGILVENGNIEQMANAMKYLLDNKEVASEYGKKATEIAITLNPKVINKNWEDYIYKIVQR